MSWNATPTGASLWEFLETPNPKTWERFVTSYGLHIDDWLRAIVNPSDLDDVRQELHIKLWLELPRFVHDPNKGKFRSYLSVVTKNFALQSRRKLKRDMANETLLEQWVDDEWRKTGIRKLIRAELIEIAKTAVRERVGTLNFQAFELILDKGLNAKEVAEQLGMTPSAVHTAKHRIAKLMRAELERLGADADDVER